MNSWKELAAVLSAAALLILGAGAVSPLKNKRVYCQQNLKKLYIYTQQYQNDHGGLPPVRIPMKPLWKFWSTLLREYAKDQYDFICPADPRAAFLFEKVRSPLYHPVEFNAACYGMNWFLTDQSARKKRSPPNWKTFPAPLKPFFWGTPRGLTCCRPASGLMKRPSVIRMKRQTLCTPTVM